ncbi:ras-related protein Rab-8A-like isoform X1 [Dysidea avara]|uniref:ras-related protein Rab-8A-like isoform X1 n=1 Tax=Dysidea avara TaxID=196820 RepID=UPI0033292619
MAAAPAHDYLIKLMFVGNGMTGKSSLLLRYADDVFTQSYIATIGIDFKVKNIEFNEKRVKLQMWDTSGQERFRQITRTYFRGTKGAIFVYDITNENSFKQIGQWINDFKESVPDAVMVVVGNKCDLENARVVGTEQGQSFADEHGCKFMETSASDNVNVNEMIMELTEEILSKIEGGE